MSEPLTVKTALEYLIEASQMFLDSEQHPQYEEDLRLAIRQGREAMEAAKVAAKVVPLSTSEVLLARIEVRLESVVDALQGIHGVMERRG